VSEALLALSAAAIGAGAGLLGAFITAREQRRLDVFRFGHERRTDAEKEKRLAVADLARILSAVLQTMSWFTWEADNRPFRVTPAWVDRYDAEMKTLLPDLMASISVVAALSERTYRAFDPLVSEAFDLDAQIGKAASSLRDELDLTREEVGELKDPAFSLFRRFRETLATEMGHHGTDLGNETASSRDVGITVEHTHDEKA
jgi:hypothetical protein